MDNMNSFGSVKVSETKVLSQEELKGKFTVLVGNSPVELTNYVIDITVDALMDTSNKIVFMYSEGTLSEIYHKLMNKYLDKKYNKVYTEEEIKMYSDKHTVVPLELQETIIHLTSRLKFITDLEFSATCRNIIDNFIRSGHNTLILDPRLDSVDSSLLRDNFTRILVKGCDDLNYVSYSTIVLTNELNATAIAKLTKNEVLDVAPTKHTIEFTNKADKVLVLFNQGDIKISQVYKCRE